MDGEALYQEEEGWELHQRVIGALEHGVAGGTIACRCGMDAEPSTSLGETGLRLGICTGVVAGGAAGLRFWKKGAR